MMKSKQDAGNVNAITTTNDGDQNGRKKSRSVAETAYGGQGVMKKTGVCIGHVPVGKDVRDAQERARLPWTGVNTLGIGGQP